MFTPWKRVAAVLSTATLLNMGAGTALALDHGHSDGAEETAQLTLNNGKKWVTDASLRQGMGSIRDALAAELPAIRAGKASAKQYQALAQKANDQIAFMVKNCKLGEAADAMLHIILADLTTSANALVVQDSNEARKGAEKIAHALENYATYFDHPGWRSLK